MKINWIVRLKNKTFWLTLIPSMLLFIQAAVRVFGFEIDLGEVGNNLIDVVNSLFVVLAVIGIVTDPTTAGINDSQQALTYKQPKESEE